MRTKIENGQSVVIESRDYVGELEAPVYGIFRGLTSDGCCIVELSDGSKKYAGRTNVESTETYEKIVAERNSRKPPPVITERGLASDEGESYDWYER
jgi:hypothetical protein